MKRKIDLIEIAKKLEGLHTAETLAGSTNISLRSAINLASKLRKAGYLRYFSGGRKKRIYQISPFRFRLLGNPGLYEILNKYSKIKLQEPFKHFIHGRKLKIEEALVLAIKSGNIRTILASLNLFLHIKNWSLLNKIAKKYNIQRNVGAFYEATKLTIKVKRMDERTRKSLLKGNGIEYIIEKLSSRDFTEIEKKWRVKIPLNLNDLSRLKTG